MKYNTINSRWFPVLFVFLVVPVLVFAQDYPTVAAHGEYPGERQPGIADLDTCWAIFRDGSVQFSEVTLRLLQDREYREAVYPGVYTLLSVPDHLEQKQIAFALWILINKSAERPIDVREIVYKLSRIGIQSQHYLQAFYTYAFADPEVFEFKDGGISMENPMVLEEKLDRCKYLMTLSDKYAKMALAAE